MIPISKPNIGAEEIRNVNEAVRSGFISPIGRFVERFEGLFSKYHGIPATSCSSGTSALHLALMGLGIGKGDEVIVPNMTFVAVPNSVVYCGATPVFCDIERKTLGIDPDEVIKLITSRTKAVIAVHLYGKLCQIEKLRKICKKTGLKLIEDCAEAIGAMDKKGRLAGTFGDVACFSFYGNKVLSTGQGGMILSRNSDLMLKMKYYKNQYMWRAGHYYHPEIGFNYRMTNIEAAIGCAQMKKLNKTLQKRLKNAQLYGKILGIKVNPLDSHWVFPVKHKKMFQVNKIFEFRRSFTPMNIFSRFKCDKRFPVSREIYDTVALLPNHCSLTSSDIKKICKFVKEYL